MRWIAIVAAVTLVLSANTAQAHTTKDLLFRCSQDEASCATKIRERLQHMESPPPGRPVLQLCLPRDLNDEELVEQVTNWINEHSPRYDNQDEDDSIAAALAALYPCGGIKGLEGDD